MANRLPRMPGGVLIPSRLTWETLSDDLSSYSESGGRPGPAEPVTEGAVYRLQVSGGQGEAIEAVAVRSGYPGSMSIGYRLPDQGEAVATDYRGWNPPMWWDSWTAVNNASGASTFRRHDIVTLPDTQQGVLVRRNASNGAVGARRVDVDTLEVDSSGATISTAGSAWEYLAACVIPDEWAIGGGRIVCLYDGRLYTSVDAGATWTLHSKHPLSDDTSTFGAVRMAYHDGQILLLIGDTGTTNTVHQYLSSDEGATFTLVEAIADLGDSIQLATTDAGFHVAYRRDDGVGATPVYCRTIASGGHSFGDAAEITVEDYAAKAGQDSIALAAEPDGMLWCIHAADAGDYVTTSYSDDGGVTWTRANGALYNADGATSLKLRYLSATFAAGRMLLAHSWIDGVNNGSLGLAALGGWSTWTTGPATGGPGWEYGDRIGSSGYTDTAGVNQIGGATWIPGVKPENASWTLNGASPTLSSGTLAFSTAAAQQWYFRNIGTGGALVQPELSVSSGGTSGTIEVGISVRVADGTDDYHCWICFTTTEIQVVDAHASTEVGTASVDMTAGIQLQVALYEDGTLTVGYRTRGSTRWTYIADEYALTSDTGSPSATGSISWGHISPSTAASTWRWFSHARYSTTYQPRLYRGGDLYGRTMTGTPTPIPDASDAAGLVPWLRASAGPARYSEVIRLPVAYDRGVHRLFPSISPSPSSPWRSADTSEQTFAFDLGQASWVGHALGLYVGKANFALAHLEYSDDGVTWATAGTLNLMDGFAGGMGYSLTGDTATFTGSTPAERYLWEGELAGGTAILTSGLTAEPRRIVWNSAGSLHSATTTRPEIRIEGIDGTEPASGTLLVYPHSGLLVVYPTSAQRRRYWRVRVPVQNVYEDYYEAGVILAGRIQPWGAEVDATRSDTWQANTSTTRNAYGVSRVRERGPLTRTWRFGWQDGAHRGKLRAGLNLDYHGVSGGLALGAGEDVADLMAGILRETRSGQIPVVVVEPLPESSETITDPTRLLYARFIGAPSANGYAGDPMSQREFLRVQGVEVEEIP